MANTSPAYRRFDESQTLAQLGETIRRVRKCAGVSQVELGKIIDVHQAAVCRIENGQQSVQPWQLQQLGEYFHVPLTSLLNGRINYWAVSERFDRTPPFPERYRRFPYSRVREDMPLVKFLTTIRSPGFAARVLRGLDLEVEMLTCPDQQISPLAMVDLATFLVSKNLVNESNLEKLVALARSEDVQGFLHPVYETQVGPLNIVKSLILNAHHYEQNFNYEMTESSSQGHSLNVTVTPAPHMDEIQYRTKELGDLLCRYKRTYLAQFPRYIGARPIAVEHQDCLYKGDSRCVYRIRAA